MHPRVMAPRAHVRRAPTLIVGLNRPCGSRTLASTGLHEERTRHELRRTIGAAADRDGFGARTRGRVYELRSHAPPSLAHADEDPSLGFVDPFTASSPSRIRASRSSSSWRSACRE